MKMSALTTSFILRITSVFVLTACLVGQDRGGKSPGEGADLIGGVFSKAHASGSLEYWGECNYREAYPDFPQFRAAQGHEGSPVELLREMFSVDPKMKVSQDPDGKIRMIEDDVPSDLLDVKIHFIRFGEYNGPNAAVVEILQAPELTAFRKEHNIGPEPGAEAGFGLSHEAFAPEKPKVWGDLENVTVRQALDYILLTFHGFWLYESCKTPEGGRTMYLGFFENAREAAPMRPLGR